ncbi:MAG: hypothetical protein Q7J68_05070, partial [Thermoplasmata archaeon]|nr:hypothetical protein [Thermoplasmata archaeon]
APNPMGTANCNVCNFDIKKDMESVNLNKLTGKLTESVSEIMSGLNESEDFEALPDELKSQFAKLVDSDDVDFDMEKPVELDALGIDLDKIEEEAVPEPSAQPVEEIIPEQKDDSTEDLIVEQIHESEEEPIPDLDEPSQEEPEISEEKTPIIEAAPAKAEEEIITKKSTEEIPEKEQENISKPDKKTVTDKHEKVKKVLMDKMTQWKKAGYDVSGLDECLEDVEKFKGKAKVILSSGKVIKSKCENQLAMWKEKGFDVSELEPLLENDVDIFMDKAKECLKKQKQ